MSAYCAVSTFRSRQLHSGYNVSSLSCYEPRVAIVFKPCQGCMRIHVYVGFVMERL